ncbi:hypothetical protein FQN50_009192 [Emmonsiellopsis sp. PD_5]|nr:hypothetical protein FQN50_009192 [Emmonsiellopsis sp. PD_5]
MATFHPFPRLPFELRARIWELTVEPRTVEIRYKYGHLKLLHVTSPTPVPAVLHACFESRNQGLYQRAFTQGVEPRYVWVNFDMDMVSIGNTMFNELQPEKDLIRRMTFSGESNDFFFYTHSKDLADFTCMEEIHVICENGLADWQDSWEYVYWPCPRENLRFIDKETGQIAVGEDLDRMWDVFTADPDASE